MCLAFEYSKFCFKISIFHEKKFLRIFNNKLIFSLKIVKANEIPIYKDTIKTRMICKKTVVKFFFIN